MSVTIKTQHEIELMREAGHLLEKVHDGLIPYIKPGVSTKEIDKIGEEMIRSMGCIPNFLNYGGFPASFCISLNDEVVHGIPSEEKIIQDGDLVKIDAGLIYKGYHSDAARTYAVGEVSKEAQQLIKVTRECFFEGLKMAKAGNVILDGRDIGTVVLPNADLKIYQIASVETRAKRRYLENLERGLDADLETIKKEIEERDYQDTHREISPLKKAEDAVELDTSSLTLEEVVEQVLTLIQKAKEE